MAITTAASFYSAYQGNKAAKSASNAQVGAAREGLAETARQFDFMQELMKPYINSGQTALNQQMNMLGLNGAGGQQASIDQLQASPFFQAQLGQGNNAILQNASATGGLRGGNTQAALAQFAPQLLQQTYQNQLQNIGGLATQGQNAAAGVGAQAINTGNSNVGLLGNIGQAQAGYALARGQNAQNLAGSISGLYGSQGMLKQASQFAGLFK